MMGDIFVFERSSKVKIDLRGVPIYFMRRSMASLPSIWWKCTGRGGGRDARPVCGIHQGRGMAGSLTAVAVHVL